MKRKELASSAVIINWNFVCCLLEGEACADKKVIASLLFFIYLFWHGSSSQ
jgi:hypothetical protein